MPAVKAKGAIDLDASVKENLSRVAAKLGKSVPEMVVLVMDRPRHEALITQIRSAGARVRLITDGDVAGAIAPSLPDSGIDLLMGIGKSAEAVLAAVGIRCLGGEPEYVWRKDDVQKQVLRDMGITDIEKKLSIEDLAKGQDLTFTATGVIDLPLKGVRYTSDYCVTHSVVMRVHSGTIRFLETQHQLK